MLKFHTWVIEERDKLATYPADPFAAAKVGAALSPLRHKQRRVEGIAIFSTSHVLIDAIGVRQLGGLASELAKQTAEQATKQQDAVLAEAKRQNLDSLYSLPPLRMRPPPARPGPRRVLRASGHDGQRVGFAWGVSPRTSPGAPAPPVLPASLLPSDPPPVTRPTTSLSQRRAPGKYFEIR